MQVFINAKGFRLEYYKRGEVSLPRFEDTVEDVNYPESKIIGIVHKNKYKKSLERDRADGLPSDKPKPSTTSADSINADGSPSVKSSAETYHFVSETPTEFSDDFDLADENVICTEGLLYDARTGAVLGRCRHEDNLRRAYNTQFDKVLSSMSSKNALFVSPTLDGIVTYEIMRSAVTDFMEWLETFENFTFGAYYLEPHADGNWHAHLPLYFREGVPEGIEDKIVKWWNDRNGKECDNQVLVERIESDEHLLNILRYLKPTRGKKRPRIKFYPLNKQPMGCFGEVQKPERRLVTFGEVEQELGEEFDDHRRRVKTHNPETDELISFVAYYFFKAKPTETAVGETYHFAESVPDTDKRSRDKPPKIGICGCFTCIADCPNTTCSKSCPSFNNCCDCLGSMYPNICPT